MYGFKFIKGTVLGTPDEEENFVLTMRSENPGNEYIQCLSVKRIYDKIPQHYDDLKYNDKNKTIYFYNESDKFSYAVQLNKFQHINVFKSNLIPLFFIDESMLNKIIMTFCCIYYGLDNDLLVLAANTKALISSISENINPLKEIEVDDNPYSIDDELLRYSVYEDACLAVQAFHEDGWNYKEFTEDDAEVFSMVLNLQPVNETRNELYQRLGISKKEMDSARAFIKKEYPDIVFKRDIN